MSIYRKDQLGQISKVGGYVIQRWNDRIFKTTHSKEGGDDYYDIELVANKYILSLTDYTEFQLYLSVANTNPNVFIRFNGKTLKVTRSDNEPLPIGFLVNKITLYTLNTEDSKIWLDVLTSPKVSDYQGKVNYALQTWSPDNIINPKLNETALALDTLMLYEWDGSEWDELGLITQPQNGYYWLVEFFPDYYFGSGQVIWNGATHNWDIALYADSRIDGEIVNDNSTTNVNHSLRHTQDITFSANLTNLAITIPFSCTHGYYAGVNFKTLNNSFPINIDNLSIYPLKIMKYNLELAQVQVGANKVVNMSFYCDGINIYCYYTEV